MPDFFSGSVINPSNAELNPTCHLLALLGAHHMFHVSRIRVKFTPLSTLRSSKKGNALYFFKLIPFFIYIFSRFKSFDCGSAYSLKRQGINTHISSYGLYSADDLVSVRYISP
jgi:hypothetical protein